MKSIQVGMIYRCQVHTHTHTHIHHAHTCCCFDTFVTVNLKLWRKQKQKLSCCYSWWCRLQLAAWHCRVDWQSYWQLFHQQAPCMRPAASYNGLASILCMCVRVPACKSYFEIIKFSSSWQAVNSNVNNNKHISTHLFTTCHRQASTTDNLLLARKYFTEILKC